VCASTAWERQSGTLPLLVAAPASPMLTFAARSLFWLASGVVTASVSLFLLAPVFGVALPWPRAWLAVPLIATIGVATYCFALVLAGLALSFVELRNVMGNLAQHTLMVLCGVQVPASFWPHWLEVCSSLLPLRHGLVGLRGLLAGEPLTRVGTAVGLELVVGLGWLAVATLTFRRLAQAGRRDGSIEFGG
jgi:ABC-2 type transport system permease protein